ncbi:MAG TPA: hypothetical protein VHR84_14705 [Terriglobales bacterium]|jgi:hypothetical protein|nr:hypothetical protein [Terriglobales bacterium]
MANRQNNTKSADAERMVDLIERLGAIALYLYTDMDHHSVARRLGMGTQRVTAILKGLKKASMTAKKE